MQASVAAREGLRDYQEEYDMSCMRSSVVLFLALAVAGAACIQDDGAAAGDEEREVAQAVSQVQLFNGYPVGGMSGAVGTTSDTYVYSIEIMDGVPLIVSLRGTSGDPDLYVRRNAVPTTDNYECASINFGPNEDCVFPSDVDSWRFNINVDGFEAYSNATLHAYFLETMSIGTANNFIWGNSATSRTFWRLDVPATTGQSLRIRTTPFGSVPGLSVLYVRRGDAPLVAHGFTGGSFSSVFDCRSETGATNVCTFPDPPSGRWYVMVEGKSSYMVTMEAAMIPRK